LANHYDQKDTHVISAIIHLGDASDKPWDFYIEDHHFRPHRVTMEHGDIVLYESATCLHGRPEPFEGDSYCNMHVHFKPEQWC
jgi:predicted 2-oxoglutarate/Fe(II)-dependent dioxygenase YbiX